MVENTLRSALKAEHKLEHLVESSEGGSQDATEQEFHQIRYLSEQAALAAIKETEKWGKKALVKVKDFTEEMII